MKRVSLKDIAKKVGVSPSTVSFVLNDKGSKMRISERLVEKIKKVAEKSGYHPNQLAVGLRTGYTKTLGLIVENISDSFFSLLAKIIEDEAEHFGYRIVYCSSENDLSRARALIRMLSHRQVDGYLITPTEGLEEDIQRLAKHDKPVVLMDRYFPNLDVSSVAVDNYNGARMGVKHLIDKGYKKIGFVGLQMDLIQMQQREKAYVDILQSNGISIKKKYILKLKYNSENSEEAIRKICSFISENKELDAIFFVTNYLGIYGLECFRQLGLSIPKDLAVVCFDDHDIFRLYPPGISTVEQPVEQIARTAIQLLMDQLKKRTFKKQQVLVAAKFNERGST
jgi:LacI family transcriptional regulator